MSNIHSTGRGGAGNIGKDTTEYADGGIVREGPAGEAGAGAEYSTGRGGAGNISDSPQQKPQQRLDDEIVPETATRHDAAGNYAEFHTGRGGQGNIHKDKYGGHSSKAEQDAAEKKDAEHQQKEGVGEKVKKALHLEK